MKYREINRVCENIMLLLTDKIKTKLQKQSGYQITNHIYSRAYKYSWTIRRNVKFNQSATLNTVFKKKRSVLSTCSNVFCGACYFTNANMSTKEGVSMLMLLISLKHRCASVQPHKACYQDWEETIAPKCLAECHKHLVGTERRRNNGQSSRPRDELSKCYS